MLWYRVSKTPVLLVISRDPTGKERDDFFFSTDLSLKPAQAIGGFAGRWSIEDTFKNTKQFLGGQELQTWKSRGPERAAMLSSVVWLWFLQQPRHRVPVAHISTLPQAGHEDIMLMTKCPRQVFCPKAPG